MLVRSPGKLGQFIPEPKTPGANELQRYFKIPPSLAMYTGSSNNVNNSLPFLLKFKLFIRLNVSGLTW